MAEIIQDGTLLWEPRKAISTSSNLVHYMEWLKEKKHLHITNYYELWKWSVTHVEAFWKSIWDYFSIQSSSNYKTVLSKREMPGAKWFEGATLNYTEHIFRDFERDRLAVISKSEGGSLQTLTWQELYNEVAAFAAALRKLGITRGDRVVAYLPNIQEAIVAFLACASIGAIWSSCSPDFGSSTVIDRFKQIKPKVFITIDGYRYGGKSFDRMATVREIQSVLPTLERTIVLPYLHPNPQNTMLKNAQYWDDFVDRTTDSPLIYEQVPFEHPLWILYSSGTTGLPKAMVQSQGGILLEHYKLTVLHSDLKTDDRFFWFTTTGWMMWNVVVSSLLSGATAILYDGSPNYPTIDSLWAFAEETKMTVFGTSASYLLNCRNEGIVPKKQFHLSHLRSIASTGSPLPSEGFQWVYENVSSNIWLVSLSGGTDLCTAFVTGAPILPVHAGEIQCRALGAHIEAFDQHRNPLRNEVGELVILEPMPSMPLYFWNDPYGERYYESYFDVYDSCWRHGDWIKITDRGSCQIYGRSDATINRGGIRIGTSEIYRVVENIAGIKDSLVIDLSKKQKDEMLLFIVLNEGVSLDDKLKSHIREQIRKHCSPRHVPNDIHSISNVPITLNGKKLEIPIKKILQGTPVEEAVNMGSVRNHKALDYFRQLAKKL